MAITYAFGCPNCNAKGEIYVGQSRIECQRGDPEALLGSCAKCKKLFGNTERQCTYCLRKQPHITLFKQITIPYPTIGSLIHPIRFYKTDTTDKMNKIPCPKCKYKYLKSAPIMFHD